jgi:hypothetical protein
MSKGGVLIGINVVSLAYLAPGRHGLFTAGSRLIELAKELGFDFVQALPVRGAKCEDAVSPLVRYYEDAWNPGTLKDFLLRQSKAGGAPRLHDILLFPSPSECKAISACWEGRGVKKIGHDFKSRLVEVSPGLNMGANDIFWQCRSHGNSLVIDTSHLQREARSDEIAGDPDLATHPPLFLKNLEQRLAALEMWRPYLAEVMHFNVNANEYLGGGEQNAVRILRHWLVQTKTMKERFIVLEYRPSVNALTNRKIAVAMLQAMRTLKN